MSTLAEKLKNAEPSRASGKPGSSLIDSIIDSITDEETKQELVNAIGDYDISRGTFRVAGRTLAEILEEEGFKVAQATIQDYRKKHKLREKALAKAGIH